MDPLTRLIDGLRANPLLSIAGAAALVVGYVLLRRKPKIQRDADQRLAALRRNRIE